MSSHGTRLRALAEQEGSALEVILGFRQFGPSEVSIPALDGRLVSIAQTYSATEKAAIFARLAAANLPAIADGLIALAAEPDANGPFLNWINEYFIILNAISQCVPQYLSRFMRSNHPAVRQLAKKAAETMCAALRRYGPDFPYAAPFHVRVLQSAVGMGCLLLDLLSLSQPQVRREALSSENRSLLFTAVIRYGRSREVSVAAGFENLVAVLSNNPKTAQRMDEFAADAAGLSECKRRGCPKTSQDAQLAVCAVCGTVAYCSPQHQHEDWNDPEVPHKGMCYQTGW